MEELRASYSGLFEEGGEPTDFGLKWGWYITLDKVAGGEGNLIEMEKLYEKLFVEVLNHLSYLIEKSEEKANNK